MVAVWMLVLMGVCALAQAVFYKKNALKRVHYARRFSRARVFAGQTVELIEVLANEKLLPVPWVRVESRIDANLRFKRQENLEIADGLFHKSLFYLGAYRRVTRTHQVTCLRRGYYDCSQVSIAGGDLLGLAVSQFNTRSSVGAPAGLPAHPVARRAAGKTRSNGRAMWRCAAGSCRIRSW